MLKNDQFYRQINIQPKPTTLYFAGKGIFPACMQKHPSKTLAQI